MNFGVCFYALMFGLQLPDDLLANGHVYLHRQTVSKVVVPIFTPTRSSEPFRCFISSLPLAVVSLLPFSYSPGFGSSVTLIFFALVGDD